ncbi:MAG: class I SAM-dependent methyltransferase [Anaerolineae bacterium]|nr:class I SAM-dependent methyltransferase [Anaerolineae bacterium]
MADRVNYDHVSKVYDQRYDQGGPVGILNHLNQIIRQENAGRLLEAGCGTSHWLSHVKNSPIACGLDFSRGMLRKAQEKNADLLLVQGTAKHLPYTNATFDLVYCVNALHHFDEPAAFIKEACRVLRPGGVLLMIGTDPHDQQHTWYVYDYFPGTLEKDLQRFPSRSLQLKWMQQAGFINCACTLVEHIQADLSGEAVLQDHFLSKNGNSQLALLSDAAYDSGIARIKTDINSARQKNREITFLTRLDLHMVYGFTPGC